MAHTLKIGTRGSELALCQAHRVKQLFENLNSELSCEIIVIKSEGDIDLVNPLHMIGGKGVFVKNLELALADYEIDVAVHSLKDITSKPAKGLTLCGFLEAEAPTDVLVLKPPYQTLQTLPPGAVLATGSLRRKAILKKLRSDIETIEIRGNVITRLKKMDEGDFQGLVLAEAGLIRLKLQDRISHKFRPQEFCPAPGQGVIALQTRTNDIDRTHLSFRVSNPAQLVKSTAELAFVESVGFDCRTPLGVYASLSGNGKLNLKVFMANSSLDRFYEEDFVLSLENRLVEAREAANKALKWISDSGR